MVCMISTQIPYDVWWEAHTSQCVDENRHIVVHTDGESYTINGLICVVDERTQASEGGHCR